MISKVIGTGTGLFNHSVRACLVLRSCDSHQGSTQGMPALGTCCARGAMNIKKPVVLTIVFTI